MFALLPVGIAQTGFKKKSLKESRFDKCGGNRLTECQLSDIPSKKDQTFRDRSSTRGFWVSSRKNRKIQKDNFLFSSNYVCKRHKYVKVKTWSTILEDSFKSNLGFW